MLITGGFEGEDPWANITGNFDGEGLTCGQLGKTIKAGDQQAIVKSYLKAHGAPELLKIMPNAGAEYISVIRSSIAAGMAVVVKWSKGSRVFEPYRSELAAFWKTPKMIEQQRLHAATHEGASAPEWIEAWGGDGSFQEFALFFDIAAQNGSLKGVTAEVVDSKLGKDPQAALDEALEWIASPPKGASGGSDAIKNAELWRSIIPSSGHQMLRRFLLAVLRSRKASPEWQWDSVNRKGTLAVGEGLIHGRKWNFLDAFGIAGPAATPVGAKVDPEPVPEPAGGDLVGSLFRVAPHIGLRLRRTPDQSSPANIITAFPQGTLVRFLSASEDPAWWKVSVDSGGKNLQGFMSAKNLSPVAQVTGRAPVPAASETTAPTVPPQPAAASAIVEVHFPNSINRPVKRDETEGRIWKLNEAGAPTREGATPAKKTAELARIIAWLNADKSERYQKTSKATFCNVYAYDFACLAGCYIPRVWWTQKGIHELTAGHTISIKYEDTVDEMTANMLYRWFRDWGGSFGWTAAHDVDELQKHANAGGISVVVANNSEGHGHITMVVPETDTHLAKRDSQGLVTVPLESQAGSVSCNYITKPSPWWTAAKYTHGFWMHL